MARLARFTIPEVPHHVTRRGAFGTPPAAAPRGEGVKRVKEVRGGKTVYTVFSRVTGGLIYRDEATDAKTTDYVNVGGAALRLKKTPVAGGFVAEYTHFDSQGSAVTASDAAGALLWRESYTPFGGIRLNPAANRNDTGYTGHLRDYASGLNYMQARYYDPAIGRFLSTDPIGYQDQLNLYAYVANDPVNLIDTDGLRAVSINISDGKVTRLRVTDDGDRLNTNVYIAQQIYSRAFGAIIYIEDAAIIEQVYSGDAKYSQRTVDEINGQIDVIARKGGPRLPDAVPGPPTRLDDLVDVVGDILEGADGPKGKRKPKPDRENDDNGSSNSGDRGQENGRPQGEIQGFIDNFTIVGNRCTGRLDC